MIDFHNLLPRIAEKIQKEPDKLSVYEDYYAVSCEALKEDTKFGVKNLKWLSGRMSDLVPRLAGTNLSLAKDAMNLHRNTLRAAALDDFDSYLLFVEWNREPAKKFYVPRRAILKQVVDELQALADDELDILGISMPPGTGKTTLAIFYLTWLAGKYPDAPMLTGSHSNSFVRGTYDECLQSFLQVATMPCLWSSAQVFTTTAALVRLRTRRAARWDLP